MTTNLQAYEKYLQGISYIRRLTKDYNIQARQLCEEAIALDSGFAAAYAFQGWTHFFDARFGWAESRVESINMAFKSAQKAILLDDTSDIAHTLLASVYLVKRQHDKAVAAAEHAVTLSPNGALVYNTLAGLVGCSGRWEDSITYGKKAIRLDPFPVLTSFHWLGRAYFMTGKYLTGCRIHLHGSGIIIQRGFQHLPAGNIQMISRLIHDQNIGIGQNQPAKHQAIALPTAQIPALLEYIVAGE